MQDSISVSLKAGANEIRLFWNDSPIGVSRQTRQGRKYLNFSGLNLLSNRHLHQIRTSYDAKQERLLRCGTEELGESVSLVL